MRPIISLSILLFCVFTIKAQRQLDIQGKSSSTDTVATIRVNYVGDMDIIGLGVHSEPAIDKGIGGYFYGGRMGMYCRSNNGTGMYGQSQSSYGVFGKSLANGVGVLGQGGNYGVEGYSPNGDGVHGNSDSGIGVYGESMFSFGVKGESLNNIGVYGYSNDNPGMKGESSSHFGVFGKSSIWYGVYRESTSSRGVYGYSGSNIGVYGQGGSSDFWAHNGSYGSSSSRRWKSNIENIPNALEKLSQLRGVYFDWDEEHGGKHTVGFIAEEVGEVLPEIVMYEENGVDAKGMDYSKMAPLLVEAANAMREEYQEKFTQQQSQIDNLNQEIALLKSLLMSQLNDSSE